MPHRLPPSLKRLLKTLCVNGLRKVPSTPTALAQQLEADVDPLRKLLRDAAGRGLVKKAGEAYNLTAGGRRRLKVVFAGGVFNIIHPGHIHTLAEARKLGDLLVVSVARNTTVVKTRGTDPVSDEQERLRLVDSLRQVDVALLGSEEDIFETVDLVRPDFITIGYDQKHDEKEVTRECQRRGLNPKVVRLASPIPHVKSSRILRKREVTKEF